jgi:hypothetical protein
MADVDRVFRSGARYFYNEIATATERSRINAILDWIAANPQPDDRLTFALSSPGEYGVLYHDSHVWIMYRMLNDWTLSVMGIGTVED